MGRSHRQLVRTRSPRQYVKLTDWQRRLHRAERELYERIDREEKARRRRASARRARVLVVFAFLAAWALLAYAILRSR